MRIKVMQNLYSQELNEGLSVMGVQKNIKKSVEEVHHLYLLYFFVMNKVVEHILIDQQKRIRKYRPSKADQTIDTRITKNAFCRFLKENDAYKSAVKTAKLHTLVDNSLVISLHKAWVKSDAYLNYTAKMTHTPKDDKQILAHLCKKIMPSNDLFISLLEDHFVNFIDDEMMIITSVAKQIHAFNAKNAALYSIFPKNKQMAEKNKFALELAFKTHKHNADFVELIEPQLKNWELERITRIDMILIKMSLCELLYFPSIPIKVSINEYIDIAKMYSTPKSKDFINGILDKIMKKLQKEGRIHKEGRGLLGN